MSIVEVLQQQILVVLMVDHQFPKLACFVKSSINDCKRLIENKNYIYY